MRLLLGEDSDDTESVQETAEWLDLRVFTSVEARTAVQQLHPLHRTLAIAYQGHAHVDSISADGPAGICREGLAWIIGKRFTSLGITEQNALLHSISDQRVDKQSENAGTRFFDFIKTETVKGFYTSRIGLKELDFKGNAYYARSPGCFLLDNMTNKPDRRNFLATLAAVLPASALYAASKGSLNDRLACNSLAVPGVFRHA